VRGRRWATPMLMWQNLTYFLWILEGKPSLAVWDAIFYSLEAWRCARACGNYPFLLLVSSSSSIFHFLSLGSPWQ